MESPKASCNAQDVFGDSVNVLTDVKEGFRITGKFLADLQQGFRNIRKFPADRGTYSGTPESFLLIAGRILEHQKAPCRLQDVFWNTRKFPANRRTYSGTPESVLQIAGRNPEHQNVPGGTSR